MDIQINKQLNRPDKGVLAAGSIITYTSKENDDAKIVRYKLTHWYDQSAKDAPKEDGWLPVAEITNFSYDIIKECTDEEYAQLDAAGSKQLKCDWLQEIIDSKIGANYTEII